MTVYSIREFISPDTLEEAYELNQKKTNRIIGGNMWLRLSNANIVKAIDLSKLGLNGITETAEEFQIGCMTPLRELEKNAALLSYTNGALKDAVKDIVGTQFRNTATIGGSIWGRFGFSDVLTAFLALDTDVELFKAGRIALADFVNMKSDNDILTKIIVKKTARKISYQALRNAATDFPVLSCCASKGQADWRLAIGARPAKAVLHIIPTDKLSADNTEAITEIIEKTVFGSNTRASAKYRQAMASVLLKRAIKSIVQEAE